MEVQKGSRKHKRKKGFIFFFNRQKNLHHKRPQFHKFYGRPFARVHGAADRRQTAAAKALYTHHKYSYSYIPGTVYSLMIVLVRIILEYESGKVAAQIYTKTHCVKLFSVDLRQQDGWLMQHAKSAHRLIGVRMPQVGRGCTIGFSPDPSRIHRFSSVDSPVKKYEQKRASSSSSRAAARSRNCSQPSPDDIVVWSTVLSCQSSKKIVQLESLSVVAQNDLRTAS